GPGPRLGPAPLRRLDPPGRAGHVQGGRVGQVARRGRPVLPGLPLRRARGRDGRVRRQGVEAVAQAVPEEQAGCGGQEQAQEFGGTVASCSPSPLRRGGNRTKESPMRLLAVVLLLAALPAFADDKAKPNTLTAKETADGWLMLF